MLSILAVFIPSFFMVGAGRALFVAISLAVGFAMLASYLLSNSLVTRAVGVALPPPRSRHRAALGLRQIQRPRRGTIGRLSQRSGWVLVGYLIAAALVIALLGPRLGVEIFPSVDVGQFQLRLRAPAGTRIERTEKITLVALKVIADEVGPQNVESTLGFVGVQPASYPINTIYLWTGGPEESVMQVQLKPGSASLEPLKERLRKKLAQQLPGVRVLSSRATS